MARSFDLILFDLGNTLIYSTRHWRDLFFQSHTALCQALLAAGVPIDPERFAARFRQRTAENFAAREASLVEITTAQILQEILQLEGFADIPSETIRQSLAAMYAVTQQNYCLEADTHATLTALRSSGCRLGLISNAADAADVNTLIDRDNLRPYFERIWISAEVGVRKPHPHIFQLALDFFGTSLARTAMVGDSLPADVQGAQSVGITAIWLTRRADSPENHAVQSHIHPDRSIPTLAALLKV
ncbi:MAG TPA: HAD family hydrolase [Anaerolineaceae bacterium]|nr:HAD family hydrolase [Anaerolineaceae bacterium]